MQDLKQKHPGKLTVNHADLLDNFDDEAYASESMAKIEHHMSSRGPYSWYDASPIKVILPLPPKADSKALAVLLRQLAQQSGFFSFGRVEFYLFISCTEAWYLSCKHEERDYLRYRAKTVLLNTMFDVEFLGKAKWTSFIPAIKRKRYSISAVGSSSYCENLR